MSNNKAYLPPNEVSLQEIHVMCHMNER